MLSYAGDASYFIQLELAEILVPFARMESGNIYTVHQLSRLYALSTSTHLCNQCPADGTPSVSKVDDIKPNKHNSCPARSRMVFPVIRIQSDKNTNQDLADHHANAACVREGLATDTIDYKDSRNCCEYVDDARNACGEKA
jgi:hypothetical protein